MKIFFKILFLLIVLFSRISYSSQNYSNQNEQKHIPVFLIADNNYAPFVATTMASILKNTKSFIEFYVVSDGISDKNKQKIANEKKWFRNFSLNFIEIDEKLISQLSKLNNNNMNKNSWSKIVYAKLFIPELNVSKKIKKAIYLDSDMIVKKDIKSLYDIDLGNYIIGAVSEDFVYNGGKKYESIYVRHRRKEIDLIKKFHNNKQCNYFNSGVILFDMEKWRKEKITEKAFKMASIIKNYFSDQTVLNATLSGKTKILDTKYNDLMNKFFDLDIDTKQYLEDNFHKTVIIHYAGTKPWHSKNVVLANEFWKIVQYTDFKKEIMYNFYKFSSKEEKEKVKIQQHLCKSKKKINICIAILVINVIVTLMLIFIISLKKKK